jgi:hypothetical protein
MRNGETLLAIVSTGILSCIIFLLVSAIWILAMSDQPQQQPQSHVIHEQSVGMAIMWRTPQTAGMTPLDVLQSAAKRMQYEQGTELGNDRNAQAIVKVLDAIATLEGRQTTTEDGFPIIE